MTCSVTSASRPTNCAPGSTSISTNSTYAPNEGDSIITPLNRSMAAGPAPTPSPLPPKRPNGSPRSVVLAGPVECLPADHRRRPGDRQHRDGFEGPVPRELRRRRPLAGALHHLHPGPRRPCRRPSERPRPRYNGCRASELDFAWRDDNERLIRYRASRSAFAFKDTLATGIQAIQRRLGTTRLPGQSVPPSSISTSRTP